MADAIILLAEDNPLTRKLVRVALSKENWELVEAHTGAAALAEIERRPFDLVLQDLVLPDLNGFELAKLLRERTVNPAVAILAFTGLLSHEDESRALGAGFDGFVSKPVEPSRLRQLVRGHLPARSGVRAFGKGKRIVVADDDALQLKLARYRLARLGFEVEAVADGAAAVEAARRSRPDAIVTDALMPALDGFGVCLQVRQDEDLRNVPIIMLTSSYLEDEDRVLAKRAGANAYVIRTPELTDLISVLEEVLSAEPSSLAAPASNAAAELDVARSHRALQQLERQVTVNSGLMHRCSTLGAELSVLTTVAEALVEARDMESALLEVLANCLDVAGASRGAILTTTATGFELRAQHGFENESEKLAALAKDPALRARAGGAEEPFEVDLGARCAALIVPMRSRSGLRGVLMLQSPNGTPKEDWKAFASAIASQVSLALSLAASFTNTARSQARLRALMESAGDAILVMNDQHEVVDLNRASEALLGRPASRILGRLARDLIPLDGEDEPGAVASIREVDVVRPDGTRTPVQVSTSRVEHDHERLILAIARDVSQQRLLEAQLRQAQKMEAIGRLAGGVAHDFNNMLSVILSYSDLLLGEAPAGSVLAADLGEVKNAGERAADLTRQLLAFSRQQLLEPRLLSVNEVVAGLEKMAKRLVGEDVALTVDVDPEAGEVLADLGQMNQVLMNLVVNARDAMPAGGKLQLATRAVRLDEAHPGGAPAGDYVEMSVTDDGIGMDEPTRARIFEPFFTTKGMGHGTGLGLATVFGIVAQSRGIIEVRTAPGRGASFRVLLPRAGGESSRRVPSTPPASARRGNETILLVEDEDAVRHLVRALLERAGYRVLDAPSAGEALLVDEQHDGEIELVLCDAVLPRMSGAKLVERLRARRPSVKVLMMSGYLAAESSEELPPGTPFMQKPITPRGLELKVRAVLDG